MMFWKPKKKPVEVWNGEKYYGNPEMDEVHREVDELIKQGFDPREHDRKTFKSRNQSQSKYSLFETPRYLRDRRNLEKAGYDMGELDYAISVLLHGDCLPKRYKVHKLKGEYQGDFECHIDYDWILVYRYDDMKLVLYALRTGTHKSVLAGFDCAGQYHS